MEFCEYKKNSPRTGNSERILRRTNSEIGRESVSHLGDFTGILSKYFFNRTLNYWLTAWHTVILRCEKDEYLR